MVFEAAIAAGRGQDAGVFDDARRLGLGRHRAARRRPDRRPARAEALAARRPGQGAGRNQVGQLGEPDLPDHLVAHRRVRAAQGDLAQQRVLDHPDRALPDVEIGEIVAVRGRDRRAGEERLALDAGITADLDGVGRRQSRRALEDLLAVNVRVKRADPHPQADRLAGEDEMVAERDPDALFDLPFGRRIRARAALQGDGRRRRKHHPDAVEIGLAGKDDEAAAAGDDLEARIVLGKAAGADHRGRGPAQRVAPDIPLLVPVGVGEQPALLHPDGAIGLAGPEGVAREVPAHVRLLNLGTKVRLRGRRADIPEARRRDWPGGTARGA